MSWASTAGVRRSMRSNRSSGTRPELRIRSALHRAGLRFRVQFPVPNARRRRIDVAFTRLKIAVYLDGCFWHGCPLHPFQPKRNAVYWATKFAMNRPRDADTTRVLEEQGWLVLRFWEHEQLDDVLLRVLDAVHERRALLRSPWLQQRTEPGLHDQRVEAPSIDALPTAADPSLCGTAPISGCTRKRPVMGARQRRTPVRLTRDRRATRSATAP